MSHRPRTTVLAAATDAVLVIAFAAIGRASHAEGVLGPWGGGLVNTAWPFLAALALGWLVTQAWRRPVAPLATGLGVWSVTVAGGMLLRAATGDGTALPFIIVTAVTLFAFLVGWRIITTAVRRARIRRARGAQPSRPRSVHTSRDGQDATP